MSHPPQYKKEKIYKTKTKLKLLRTKSELNHKKGKWLLIMPSSIRSMSNTRIQIERASVQEQVLACVTRTIS